MAQTRRTVISAIAVALLAAAFVGPAAAATDELKEVRIGFQRAGIFPATKQRHTVEDALKSRGIEVKWVEFAFGPPLLEALNTGNIDYGYTGDAPPIFAQAARANLLYVAALPSAGRNEAIVVPENSPIKTVADLKGKRVGFAKASSSHNTTVAALEKAGLSYSDITPVYLAPADAAVAFAGGNLDAWTIWDPYLALVEKGKVRVIVSAKDVHDANAFFLANRDFTGKHPDVVAKLNQIFADESVWATDHHPEIVKALHESTGLETEALTRAVDRTLFLVTPVTDKVVATQQTVADRFYKLGLVPKPVNVREIVWTWTPGS
ncbi:MAG TPA: aliphatic sulfonate ABC transporter substrate-binding protein [Rhodopseudomonas sp.]|uniref:aliphatic sulfonate ABC transporter substrate-binding protein n=1 Tax=Rhodopseudomonas sp. TaxID=1078 RepID=UPI002EDA4924